jgi:DNA-directed RNA polymerase specialized sigma24 family protein
LIRDSQFGLGDASTAIEGVASAFELPDLLTEAEKSAMQRAFRRLKPTQREMLWFRFVEGWTATEMVDEGLVQGVRAATLRVYINRATTRLKELFDRELLGTTETDLG